MNKYVIELSPIMDNWAWVKREGVEIVAMGKIANISEVADLLNQETTPLLETIAAKDVRIAELEAQLAELTAPKPVTCDQCKMPIEGVAHTRYGLHAEYTLCGACVTENED